MCEILAPAGDEKSFYAAIDAGADAVYLGLSSFSARQSAENFCPDNLKKYIDHAHALHVRVYVAMNTLVKDVEMESFVSALVAAHNSGADAIIMQDIFLGKLIKDRYSAITLHLSTQAGVCNIFGARLAKRYGFSRVILARETPLKDVKEIASMIETEVFVQGALCTCFSGQCYMSALAGGNSGNRGACKQPCRQKYKIDREGFDSYAYALSLSDLCAAENLSALIEAGVSSFKIEGRMRSPEYVRAAVTYYKDVLSENSPRLREDFSRMKRAFNRGDYTKGYLYGQAKDLLSRDVQNHLGERIGVLRARGKRLFAETSFVPRKGDGFKVIRGGKNEVGGFVYSENFPCEKNGFYLPSSERFREGDALHVTSDTSLCERDFGGLKRKILIDIEARSGEKLRVTAKGDFASFSLESEFCAQIALSSSLSENDVRACFSKTDAYPFSIDFGAVNIGENVFVVRSQLNAFRRAFYQALYELLTKPKNQKIHYEPLSVGETKGGVKSSTAVLDTFFDEKAYAEYPPDIFVLKPNNYKNIDDIKQNITYAKYYVTHILLYVPAYTLNDDLIAIRNCAPLFQELYCEGAFGLELGKELDLPVFAGTGFNIFNRADISVLKSEGVENFCVSKEISLKEAENLFCRGAFYAFGGNVKAMDLGHCLFSKTCRNCDKKNCYVLADEAGREFPLRRYENSVCRFELYNCAPMVCAKDVPSKLYDFTALPSAKKRAYLQFCGDENALKNALGKYTANPWRSGVR